MALQYKIKAGRLTNLTDARYFSAMGVDWLGFSLDVLEPHAIPLKDLKEIRQWLFEPNIVLECGRHQDRMEMVHLASEAEASAVQVDSGHAILEDDHFLLPVFVVLDVNEMEDDGLLQRLRRAEFIKAMILRPQNGNFDLEEFREMTPRIREQVRRLRKRFDIFLELPFEPGWLIEVLEATGVSGFHITGDLEEKPGISRVDEYAPLLELVESDEID